MANRAAKRPRLQGSDEVLGSGIAMMLTDVEEAANGTLLLWGLAAADTNIDGATENLRCRTMLLVCSDYQPYFFFPCPQMISSEGQELRGPFQQDLQRLMRLINARCGGPGAAVRTSSKVFCKASRQQVSFSGLCDTCMSCKG